MSVHMDKRQTGVLFCFSTFSLISCSAAEVPLAPRSVFVHVSACMSAGGIFHATTRQNTHTHTYMYRQRLYRQGHTHARTYMRTHSQMRKEQERETAKGSGGGKRAAAFLFATALRDLCKHFAKRKREGKGVPH